MNLFAGFVSLLIFLVMMIVPLAWRWRLAMASVMWVAIQLAAAPLTYRDYRFALDGVHTTGVLVDKLCDGRHSMIAYRFVVKGTEYTERGHYGGDAAECDTYRIGAQLPVTYLQSDPSISLPWHGIESEFGVMALVALVFAATALWLNGQQQRLRDLIRAKRRIERSKRQ